MPDVIRDPATGESFPYIRRPEWGARPPRHRSSIVALVRLFVHYTVTRATTALAAGIAAVRSVQAFHMDVRGWSDIAYSLLVDNAGRIYEGRGPGIAGGHTKGWNSRSEAVCWIGGPDDTPSPAAKRAIHAALGWLNEQEGADAPTYGHRDVASTGCPGDPLWQWVHAGMPLDGGPGPVPPEPPNKEWDEMATEEQVKAAAAAGAAEAVGALLPRIKGLEARLDSLALGEPDYQGNDVPKGGLLETMRQLAPKSDGARTIRTLGEMIWNRVYNGDATPRDPSDLT